jgi:UDP-N-acetylmuramoylalanine--D-glutamate ligase
MIGHILGRRMMSEANRADIHIGGNIGGSLLNQLADIHENDWVVLELSSFMLESLREMLWSPHIAVITNYSPNHLDWHDTAEAYRSAKQVVLDSQDPSDAAGDIAVLGPGAAEHFASRVGNTCVWSEHDMEDLVASTTNLCVPGRHNRINAILADWVVDEIDDNIDGLAALSDFPGLPHRLQLVADHHGVRYYNDSKCTTPEAARLAIESFAPGSVHIILGGYDKGADLKPLAGFASSLCKAVYAIGATSASFAGDNAIQCATLDRAMAEIRTRVEPGDVVLLSPACASWDQFDHYEQRGEAFTALAQASADAVAP